MKHTVIKTRVIVIAGYCFLVALAITGAITIYLEVLKSNQNQIDNSLLKKELVNLNNTLATMYQAEGAANLLAFADNENLKQDYDSLTHRIFDQIDSLRLISENLEIQYCLDNLSALLLKKHNHSLEMNELMKQIDNNIMEKIIKETIITRSDIDKLNSLLINATEIKDDTARIISEKKNFFQRIKDVIKPNIKDTITQITRSSTLQTKEIISPILTDTIIHFIQQVNRRTQQKNSKIIQQLIVRQQELYVINGLTVLQINQIMDTLNALEYQMNLDDLKEKNERLQWSTLLVALIALLALVVTVFFVSWTLKSLNEVQKLQKNIQEAKKHVEKLLTSKEQLIYTITHDIKAPISSIMGFLDLMPEDTLSQKQQYYISNMNLSATHILDLVKNLLDFQSMEIRSSQLNKIAFSPHLLLRNIYESFIPLTQRNKLTLELNSTLPENQKFLSDPYYIRQILNNLLSNAVKFTPEKGRISLLSSLENQNQWKVSIQDNGPGIDPSDQVKIFEEFIRLDETKKEVEGTGLGLTISKKYAMLLGGDITVESQKDEGSVFSLLIPLVQATEEIIPVWSDSPETSSVRILFVDDDVIQLNLLSELMRQENQLFVCCSNPLEALDRLQKESFDLVFTDIHIPEIGGFELVKQIRKFSFPKAAAVPVIAFSAECQQSEDELKKAGFDEFLLKPFKANQLLDIIEKYTSSVKRDTDEKFHEKEMFGLEKIMEFVSNDREAAVRIIDSFIEETQKNGKAINLAFQKKDKEAIRQLSHKMLSLMRMISAKEIVSILNDFEKGEISTEKKVTLFRLMEEKMNEAEATRKILEEMVIVNN
jgi:signal transduction histidine kinase/CheY-like chemotaxis protein